MRTQNLKPVFAGLLSTLATLAIVASANSAQAVEVAFERDTNLPVVNLNIAVKAGAVTDPQGQSGITNFMGEMLLRGTKKHTKEQLDLALDQMGATLEVETRAEALILRGAVLASQVGPFLDIVNEIITQPRFPESEVKKLKSQIVSNLLEELGSDQALGGKRFTQFLFNGHPYGKPVMGNIRDVEKLTGDQIRKHYDALIKDKLLLVVGNGDANEGQIRSWADQLANVRPSAPGDRDFVEVPQPQNPEHRRLLIVDKADRTQTQISAGQIGMRMTDADFFPVFLGNHAFGGGSFSARLMVEIRVKRGWSYGANSYFKHGLKPRSWQVHLFPASKDTAQALALSLKMIEDLQKNGITKEEFEFSKRSLVNSAGFMYNTPKKRVENKLLERTLNLPDGFMKTYGPELAKVTLPQVNQALSTYLKPEKLSIAVLATAADMKEPLAKAAGVPLDQVVVQPYTEEKF
ncbi:MAG: insulinase family protein [Methylotenera sp.]|nr:insulinase family protein [Oligoflexia bacterium]